MTFIGWQIFYLPLDPIQLADIFEGLFSKGALVSLMQIEELTPRMSHAADFRDAVAKTSLVT